MYCFFFFKQKTAYELRISDWSSDVCSSDLKVGWDVGKDLARVRHIQDTVAGRARIRIDANQGFDRDQAVAFVAGLAPDGVELVEQTCAAGEIGRASWRERVCQYV